MPFKDLPGDLPVMLAILHGERPLESAYHLRFLDLPSLSSGSDARIRTGDRAPFLWNLMRRCWKHRVVERPKIKEVVSAVCHFLLV